MSLFLLISHPACLIRCDGALTQLSYVRLKDHGVDCGVKNIQRTQAGKAWEINPEASAICSHETTGERRKKEEEMQSGLTCLWMTNKSKFGEYYIERQVYVKTERREKFEISGPKVA